MTGQGVQSRWPRRCVECEKGNHGACLRRWSRRVKGFLFAPIEAETHFYCVCGCSEDR